MFLYFLIDTSGSMDGAKIESVNDTMENVISELKLHSQDIDMFVNVISFARKSKWMFKQPTKIDDLIWLPLSASGMTSLGNACKQLTKNIEQHVNQDEITIVLLSDGLPTDDFEEGFDKLNDCLYNKKANRYAIALEGADIATLNKFTNNQNTVFQLESLENLLELILSTIYITTTKSHQTANDDIDDEWA